MGYPGYWTNEMTNAALEHLEDNKGITGLYMRDRNAALEDGVKFLTQSFPGRKLTNAQLYNKFEKLWIRQRRPEVSKSCSIFLEGRNALVSDYDRDTLLKPNSNNRAKDLKSRRRSINAARHRQSRASSIACNKPARVPGNRERDVASALPTSLRHESVFPSSRRAVSASSSDLSYSHIESPKATSSINLLEGAQRGKSGSPGETIINPYGGKSGSPGETIINTYASLRGGAHEKRQAAVNEYLLDNPEIYVPSQSLLEHLRGVTMKEILFAVRDILEATKTEPDKAPQLYASLSSLPFFDICKRIYGVGRKEDLRRNSEGLLSHSPVTMKDFLRTMVAAAVNEWVFDGRHESLPDDLETDSGVMAIYRGELARLYPELHEQILRKSKYIFVNERLDLNVFVAELSDRLNGALRPFLGTNLSTINSETHTEWRNNLDKIFLSALRLKAKVMLGTQQFSFVWPRAEETFNFTTMRTENRINTGTVGKVHMALFPALVQNLDTGIVQDRSKERIIFPAFVILQ